MAGGMYLGARRRTSSSSRSSNGGTINRTTRPMRLPGKPGQKFEKRFEALAHRQSDLRSLRFDVFLHYLAPGCGQSKGAERHLQVFENLIYAPFEALLLLRLNLWIPADKIVIQRTGLR